MECNVIFSHKSTNKKVIVSLKKKTNKNAEQ